MDKLFNTLLYLKHRQKIITLIDLFIVTLGTITAIQLDRNTYISEIFEKLIERRTIQYLLVVIVIYYILFKIMGTTKSLWSYLGTKEIINICTTVIIAHFLTFIVYLMIYPEDHSKLRMAIISPLLNIAGMMFVRVLYRATQEKRTPKTKNTLIIGAGDAGYVLSKELEKNNKFKANIIGFIDDNRTNTKINGIKVLGTTKELSKIIEEHKIELIFLAIPSIKKDDKNRILNKLKENPNIKIKIMKPDLALQEEGSITSSIDDISIEDLLGRGEVKLKVEEIKSYIKNKKVLITGAGGSIGSQIAREIYNFQPANLVLLDMNENSLYMLERDFDFKKRTSKKYKDTNYISEITNIREKKSLEEIFKKYNPDVVFHAAAHKHVPLMERRPQEAIKNNVFGTKNVIDVAISNKVERFIMISTDKAVNPTNIMGASKRLTEIILQSKGDKEATKFAAVRFGNVLGSNGSVIPIFKEQIKKGGPITITHRNIIRYFMTIPEAAQLVLQAGYYAKSGEIFLLDMGEPVKIIDLAKNLIKLSGLEPDKDIKIEEIGLRPGEKMYEELTLDYETSEKTENKMIFKNTTIEINIEQLDKQLNKLEQLLEKEATKEELKKELFDIINSYNK